MEDINVGEIVILYDYCDLLLVLCIDELILEMIFKVNNFLFVGCEGDYVIVW